MSTQEQTVTVKLSEPMVFADLNTKEGLPEGHERSEIKVRRLKFKHFREMQNMKEEQQMMFALTSLTGLSEDDLDELYAEDAAELTSVIYGFMQKYIELAKQMMA